ncbi:uncharacterized protein CLUP02_10682 [Colletotrichum lupini]|uniref:Uncharacterized protein n=1 Tax=Colletotrichum lupini TaxID=145971 RepID=A0A9Q8SX72_9PEZI|nr:uncharacterized protein CLUP02_10682 [Colletotrichum lupini]UQC85186.1 hypothetical protein CLUP02_10682 [Colletotrichum lupini]
MASLPVEAPKPIAHRRLLDASDGLQAQRRRFSAARSEPGDIEGGRSLSIAEPTLLALVGPPCAGLAGGFPTMVLESTDVAALCGRGPCACQKADLVTLSWLTLLLSSLSMSVIVVAGLLTGERIRLAGWLVGLIRSGSADSVASCLVLPCLALLCFALRFHISQETRFAHLSLVCGVRRAACDCLLRAGPAANPIPRHNRGKVVAGRWALQLPNWSFGATSGGHHGRKNHERFVGKKADFTDIIRLSSFITFQFAQLRNMRRRPFPVICSTCCYRDRTVPNAAGLAYNLAQVSIRDMVDLQVYPAQEGIVDNPCPSHVASALLTGGGQTDYFDVLQFGLAKGKAVHSLLLPDPRADYLPYGRPVHQPHFFFLIVSVSHAHRPLSNLSHASTLFCRLKGPHLASSNRPSPSPSLPPERSRVRNAHNDNHSDSQTDRVAGLVPIARESSQDTSLSANSLQELETIGVPSLFDILSSSTRVSLLGNLQRPVYGYLPLDAARQACVPGLNSNEDQSPELPGTLASLIQCLPELPGECTRGHPLHKCIVFSHNEDELWSWSASTYKRDICGRTPSTASTSNRLLFPAWAGLSLAPVLQIALTLFFWRIRTLESRHGQTQASGLPSTLLEPRVRVRRHLFPPKLRCRVAPNHLEQTSASRTTSVVYFYLGNKSGKLVANAVLAFGRRDIVVRIRKHAPLVDLRTAAADNNQRLPRLEKETPSSPPIPLVQLVTQGPKVETPGA